MTEGLGGPVVDEERHDKEGKFTWLLLSICVDWWELKKKKELGWLMGGLAVNMVRLMVGIKEWC